MPRRTAWQDHRLNAYAERVMLRELAQSVPCRPPDGPLTGDVPRGYCGAPVSEPCVYVDGEFRGQPKGKLDCALRIEAARQAARRADE